MSSRPPTFSKSKNGKIYYYSSIQLTEDNYQKEWDRKRLMH